MVPSPNRVWIVDGAAGVGKTSIIRQIIALKEGRAATKSMPASYKDVVIKYFPDAGSSMLQGDILSNQIYQYHSNPCAGAAYALQTHLLLAHMDRAGRVQQFLDSSLGKRKIAIVEKRHAIYH